MTPLQSLYFALGEIAYAIAKSDGEIQKEELTKLHTILEEELNKYPNEIPTTEIIFEILKRGNQSPSIMFKRGINEIKLNASFFNDELRQHFINVIQKVAEAFPPITPEEMNYLIKFNKTLAGIKTTHFNK
jgi:uncharacterized tellurite resistance protein B-like protein